MSQLTFDFAKDAGDSVPAKIDRRRRGFRPRPASSVMAEANFRARLAELGAELLEPEWLGARNKHHVRCAAGHDCWPMPNSVQQGQGICLTCSGKDPVAAETAFRARVAELSGTVLGPYVGHGAAVHVRCAAGHDCYPWPTSVQQGRGICLTCAGKDPVATEARFRARLAELGATPLYEKYENALTPHHVRCVNGHDCYSRPGDVLQGDGVCRACAGHSPALAEANFRARLAEIGATPLFEKWLGVGAPHHVRCAAGHDCWPWPCGVRDGGGVCITCVGTDPAASEAKFLARLTELAAEPLYEAWLGSGQPHPVRCSAGHDCRPRPSDVIQGHGVCRMCACREWDAFYVVTSGTAVKFGITSGDPRIRLRTHAAQGYSSVALIATELPDGIALMTEDAVRATLALAEQVPIQGREYFDVSCLALILDVAASWLGISA